MPKIPAGQKAAPAGKPGRGAQKAKQKGRRANAPHGQAAPRARRTRGRVSVKALTEFREALMALRRIWTPI